MSMSPRSRWFSFGVSTAIAVIAFWSLSEQGFDWSLVGGAFLFGTCALLALFQPLLEAFKQRRMAEALCRITHRGFTFDRGYEFPFGAMKGRKVLPFTEVRDIRLNTFPPTALVNGNELIFLTGLKKEDVAAIAVRHGVKTSEPVDIWELLGEEFLDTELDEEEKRRTLQRLSDAGVPKEEVLAIRKKLQRRMLWWTYASMEWIYCGHYDVLGNRWPVSRKTYWWTMELALRKPHA